MSSDLCRPLVEDFLASSWTCVEALVKELANFKKDEKKNINLFSLKNGQKNEIILDHSHFFLRASAEYTNPQLTVEELQGIIAARLLEVCGNYFHNFGLHESDGKDIDEICELLKKPSQGMVTSFLLNTDDVEPDRYSMNPLKESIVNSGQSAFAAASVKTEDLQIDRKFAQKYEGSLISKDETALITHHLENCNNSYVDLVDAVKYEQLETLSEQFGINLCLYSIRMPLMILEKETSEDLLHHIIKEVHANYRSIEGVYACMGRSISNRTTLLTIPHSEKGYGSKRAARGKIYFEGTELKNVKVNYKTTLLYPNAIDPSDISVAKADDNFTVEGDRLVNYNFRETPSSPQFFLYSLGSPENAAIWHGIGVYGASELLRSYSRVRLACSQNSLIRNLKETYGVTIEIPLQFNLVPKNMWVHPLHRNIDASISCVEDLKDLVKMGMKLEILPAYEKIPQQN